MYPCCIMLNQLAVFISNLIGDHLKDQASQGWLLASKKIASHAKERDTLDI